MDKPLSQFANYGICGVDFDIENLILRGWINQPTISVIIC